MWIKWIGIVLLFILCNGWGIWLAARYQTRVNILLRIKEMTADMHSVMGSLLCTPGEWMSRYRVNDTHPFIQNLLDALKEETEQHPSERYSVSWDKAITRCIANNTDASALTREDISALKRIGNGLGVGDKDTLLRNITYSQELIGKQCNEAVDECKRKKGMFLRMGFLIGLAAVIILV